MTGSTVNNIIYGNSDTDTELDQKQAYINGTALVSMSYSCIMNGAPASFIGMVDNISEDPLFLDPLDTDGGDDIFPSQDDGFSIQPDSPCIDAASESFSTSADITGLARPQQSGVDMGAYESPGAPETPCPGDFNDDNVVNVTDLLIFMSAYGCPSNCGIQDISGDDVVNVTDLLIFMSAYGSTCEP
jgi:hypothetical protein